MKPQPVAPPTLPQVASQAPPARESREPAGDGNAQAIVPPTGEASLWDLLTAEERDLLDRQEELGPLTYRADGRPGTDLPVPTGGRIDLRG